MCVVFVLNNHIQVPTLEGTLILFPVSHYFLKHNFLIVEHFITMTSNNQFNLSIAEIVGFYFKRCDEDEDKRVCNKCKKEYKQKAGQGYTNLKTHMLVCVGPEYKVELEQILNMCRNKSYDRNEVISIFDCEEQKEYFFKFLHSPKENQVYKWLEWVVMRNMPLTEVDHPLTRGIGQHYNSVCSKSLSLYIRNLIPILMENIKNDLSVAKFALAIDGWTNCSVHYLAVFAIFINVSTKPNNIPLCYIMTYLHVL
jgi:BED zinc finger